MMKILLKIFVGVIIIISCSENDEISSTINPDESNLYFPPLISDNWQSLTPSQLGWNTNEIYNLLSFLQNNNTRAFIILKDGKIVIEEYFGNTLLGDDVFNKNSLWYWASAGKTLTATLVGIAQQEGVLNIENTTSTYLGEGWTSLTPEKEELIKVKKQLTMTTGLDYNIDDLDCTLSTCLTYNTDAGTQWFYHNGVYTLLKNVVENATGFNYNDYTYQKIGSIIGMNGQWITQGYNSFYMSTARDMAKFGLLALNEGKWNESMVINDSNYYNQMVTSSQDLNLSYGYLWWLNGKDSIIYPGFSTTLNTSLSENAPSDLYAGLGKNGQFIEVIPSKNLVVIRMGESPDDSPLPIAFHNELWGKINLVIN